MNLYLDTTKYIVLGLFDNSRWLEYCKNEDVKQSTSALHYQIDALLEKHNCSVDQLEGLYICSGPGSYTGMRVAEVIAQVFELSKIPVYSFYHFELASLLGEKTGVWRTSAFKGEEFVYTWDGESHSSSLVSKKKEDIICDIEKSLNLLKKEFFSLSKCLSRQKIRKYPFYFRHLDDEFKIKK